MTSTHTRDSTFYFPSKSSAFGHALRRRRLPGAWELVSAFHANCSASAAIHGTPELEAWLQTTPEDAERARPVIERALDRLGPPDRVGSRGAVGEAYTWQRSEALLAQDLALIASEMPLPKTMMPALELRFTQRFVWSDRLLARARAAGHPEAHDAGGEFTFWFGRSAFVQPTLFFPYSYDDPALLDVLREITPHLPFRLHPSHFRATFPAKRPGQWTVRKLPWPLPLGR